MIATPFASKWGCEKGSEPREDDDEELVEYLLGHGIHQESNCMFTDVNRTAADLRAFLLSVGGTEVDPF